ncbi:class I SAM-dependent methyltransferase [Frateuria sp. GZRR33]|uniref:class I SAM-dependent methyltransferase n=1 Tax=Frateuria sp. GZRR33 TaxID=3351535 RepID=UPI003EDC486B
MDVAQPLDGGQSALWNGAAGHAWVAMQQVLDQMFEPFEAVLVAAAAREQASEVLDVGCGAGSTTLALAARSGAQGSCLGIDVSEPLVALARQRAGRAGAQARFLCADAESHPFAPERFDFVTSRFGVMFFADPVRAFENLRRAAAAGAALNFVAWRSAADNPFMTAAERAAAPWLPSPAGHQPGGPGQFAFGDGTRVRQILERSGWVDIAVKRLDRDCAFAARDLEAYLTQMGPLGRALPHVDAPTRARVIDAARAAFEPYVHGAEVRFTAACWQVEARAPARADRRRLAADGRRRP